MRWPVALAMVAVGCGVAPIEVDRSKVVEAPAQAEKAVTHVAAAFGLAKAPVVYWYRGDADCWGGIGFKYGDRCLMGAHGSDGIIVVNAGDDVPVSSSAITHELAHEAFGDHDHACRLGSGCQTPVWGADPNQDYEPGTRVGDENAALIALGL